MSITKQEVQYVAKLARLYLDDDQAEVFTEQLDQILGYIDQLNEIDVQNVAATSQSIATENVLRDDVVDNTYDRELSLSNAPLKEDGFFKVPKVIE